ncbi:MAG: hypothetical protein FJ253_02585 [Phycisphaerae bacterium]|nr:hypothetical protein [Phycisphaerae bacterium]
MRASDFPWFASHIALAALVAPWLWHGTAFMRSVLLRAVFFTMQAAIAFVLYMLITYFYVFEIKGGPHSSGDDSGVASWRWRDECGNEGEAGGS